MTTFNGTAGDDSLIDLGNGVSDTYQLGAGNDTISYSATVDSFGVLSWTHGFDTIDSTDGGVVAPNYDKIVIDFSPDYIWGRVAANGLDFELSIYSTVQNGNGDPSLNGATEVGRITLKDAFIGSIGDRLSRIEGPTGSAGFYFEAIPSPTADLYGHTAIYKMHNPNKGDPSIAYVESFSDSNNNDTQWVEVHTDGSAIVRYYDVDSNQTWQYQEYTYSNYATLTGGLTSIYYDTNLVGTSGNV